MVPKLFVDTWGWLTLYDKSESKHSEVVEFYTSFRRQNGKIYTTDYVLDETFTLLFKRLPASQASSASNALLSAFATTGFDLIWINKERFAQTVDLRLKYLDKPQISFTDLTSMVVMQGCAVVQVLTGDAHFIQVGLGFERVP